jgi:archaellum component FlaF (FlaF/FlaG flagellin family)
MNNTALIINSIVLTFGIILLLSIDSNHRTTGLAQTNNQTTKVPDITPPYNVSIVRGGEKSTTTNTVTTTNTTTTFLTFSAMGTISSLNFYNNVIPQDIAAAKKIVLSGYWNLHVNNGKLSFFEADFVAAPDDGSTSHTHQLTNFISSNNTKPIQITGNGSTVISGAIDVRINGINIWNDVKVTIFIFKGSTITITLDDIETEHHFTRQPIYGIVDRLAF